MMSDANWDNINRLLDEIESAKTMREHGAFLHNLCKQQQIVIAERDAEIAELNAQVLNLQSDLEYRRNYASAAFAQQREEIALLRQQVNAIPVDALRRYVHSGALYNESVLEVRYYTAEDFDNDAAAITEWVDGNKTVTASGAEIAALRQQVAELQAWKDAVPVDALRYIVYDCDIRYAEGADDVIRKWLKEE